METGERSAYYGISTNLITYLSGPLREKTAVAAASVNTWAGMASALPVVAAFFADAYLGRYWTIVAASILYVLVYIIIIICFFNWFAVQFLQLLAE